MSFGKNKQKQQTNEVQTAALDPLAREALTDVLNQSRALFGSNAPIFAPTDPATFAGLNQLESRPISPFIPVGGDQLTSTLAGDFLGLQAPTFNAANQQALQTLGGEFFDPSVGESRALNRTLATGLGNFDPRLEAVQDAIFNSARQAVGDQFTGTGRTGAPGEFNTLGRTVSRELAPFAFDALNQERSRELAVRGQNVSARVNALGLSNEAFARERANQLSAAQFGQQGFFQGRGNQLGSLSAIPGLDLALDSAANRQLAVGDIRRAEAQRELDTPFTRVERFANPLIAAAGGFPVTLTREGQARGSSTNFGFNLF